MTSLHKALFKHSNFQNPINPYMFIFSQLYQGFINGFWYLVPQCKRLPYQGNPGNFPSPPPDHFTHSCAKGFGSCPGMKPRDPSPLSVFSSFNLSTQCPKQLLVTLLIVISAFRFLNFSKLG